MKIVKVYAPATVANVVCGFDCLGFAMNMPFDEITARLTDEKELKIKHLDNFNLPTDPNRNVAGKAALALLDAIGYSAGIELEIKKGIKPGSGIGSSAASAVGAVVAINELLSAGFHEKELLEFALEGEFLASESHHADNLAPCLLGGFVLVRSHKPLDFIKLNYPSLFVTILHPQLEIKTSEARKVLPKDISLKSAISAWANLGALVAALEKSDYELLARSLHDDIIEPARKGFIPKFDELKCASLKVGAIGGGISGSGPSVFMLSDSEAIARRVENEMARIFSSTNVSFKTYVSSINPTGVRVVTREI